MCMNVCTCMWAVITLKHMHHFQCDISPQYYHITAVNLYFDTVDFIFNHLLLLQLEIELGISQYTYQL